LIQQDFYFTEFDQSTLYISQMTS